MTAPGNHSFLADPVFQVTDKDRVIENDPMRGGGTTSLTEEQAQANNEDFQRAYPVTAELQKYRHPYDPNNKWTPQYVGRKAREWISRPNAFSQALDGGILPGALATGALAAGTALGGSWLKNWLADDEHQTNTGRNTLLALLAGGGLGAWLAYQRMQQPKAASRWFNDPSAPQPSTKELVLKMLAQAPGLGADERFQYMAAVSQLRATELRNLAALLRSVGGAALGAVLARFFLGKGLLRSGAGAVLGLAAGSAFTGNRKPPIRDRNVSGQYYAL